MSHEFCPGYCDEPFATLCREYPGDDVYPVEDFRSEWGPIFHRGRLDGTARVLVLGQDPATHEAITRRILVGEAGQRTQGLLARLGVDRSYVMVNTFLYSVYGQGGGERHSHDDAIAAYRNRWLDALLVGSGVEVVVTLGTLAAGAFAQWKSTPNGAGAAVTGVAVMHPTYPESAAAAGTQSVEEGTRRLLANWNAALPSLHAAVAHPDTPRPLELYGDVLLATDLAAIPEADLPAGAPGWMRSLDAWAARKGASRDDKRATIEVVVPTTARPWSTT